MDRVKYYEVAFERLEKEKKNTWNWAAFFCGPSWLAYRKMPLSAVGYWLFADLWTVFCLAFGTDIARSLVGDIFAAQILQVLGIFSYNPNVMVLLQNSPTIILSVLTWLLCAVLLGYFGNALYYETVKDKIRKGYHLMENYRPTSVPAMFMGAFSNFAIFAVDFFSNKRSKAKLNNVEINKENIHAYLNPGKKNSKTMKCMNVLICVLFCLNVTADTVKVTTYVLKQVKERLDEIQQVQQSQNVGN